MYINIRDMTKEKQQAYDWFEELTPKEQQEILLKYRKHCNTEYPDMIRIYKAEQQIGKQLIEVQAMDYTLFRGTRTGLPKVEFIGQFADEDKLKALLIIAEMMDLEISLRGKILKLTSKTESNEDKPILPA